MAPRFLAGIYFHSRCGKYPNNHPNTSNSVYISMPESTLPPSRATTPTTIAMHHSLPVLTASLLLLAAQCCLAAESPRFPTNFRYDKFETNYRKLPKRDQLPLVPGNLPGSAWLWGADDGVCVLLLLLLLYMSATRWGADQLVGWAAWEIELSYSPEGFQGLERDHDWRDCPAQVWLRGGCSRQHSE